MNRRTLVTLATAVTIALLALLPVVRRVASVRTATTVVASPEEALVLVSKMDVGWKGSPVSFAAKRVERIAGSWGPVPDRHYSMDVFVVTPAGVRRETVDGLGGFQGVVDGKIVANVGGRLSRWHNGRFAEVPPAEVKATEVGLRGLGSLPEGWTGAAVGPIREPAERAFNLGDRQHRVRVWRDGEREWMTISDDTGRRLAEWSIEGAARSVDEQAYRSLFHQ